MALGFGKGPCLRLVEFVFGFGGLSMGLKFGFGSLLLHLTVPVVFWFWILLVVVVFGLCLGSDCYFWCLASMGEVPRWV